MSINFLEKIKSHVEKRVLLIPDIQIEESNNLNFCDIFTMSRKPVIISEIKFASPSYCQIYPGKLSHLDIASKYLNGGAAALSVLTEPNYFKGNIDYIKNIRATNPKSHILLKDFILSKKQIAQALLVGANAILLIAAFLEESLLKELYEYAQFLGLTSIIEVHNIQELERVLIFSPVVIGINNRNLHNLNIDLDISRKLIKQIPDNCYVICESGIENSQEMLEMLDIGFNGFLIGSSLMRHKNPGVKLQQLIKEVRNES